MRCNLCGRAGAGSTWHILAECLTPALITVRSKGASELGKHASEIWRTVGAEGPCPPWDQAYRVVGGQWGRPQSWPEGDPRAGNDPNPWYGLLDKTWFSRILRHAPLGQEVKTSDAGRCLLRALSTAAVQVCRQVWQQAAKLWAEQDRGEEERATARGRAERAERIRLERVEENKRRAANRSKGRTNPIYRKRVQEAKARARQQCAGGGVCKGWSREGDTLIGDRVRGAVKTQAVSLAQARDLLRWASSADLTWISDLMTPDGTDWIEWPQALRWGEWPVKVRALAVAVGYGVCGGWANRVQAGAVAVWGNGIRIESLVTRVGGHPSVNEGAVGIVRAWNKPGQPVGARVEWLKGHWCCRDGCTCCGQGNLRGRWWVAGPRGWKCSETAEASGLLCEVDPRDLVRVWGAEASSQVGRRKVWVHAACPSSPPQLLQPPAARVSHRHALPSLHQQLTRTPGLRAGGWKGDRLPQEQAVRAAWAAGLPVVAVSDGSYITGALREMPAHTENPHQQMLSCGWVLAAAVGVLTGEEQEHCPPLLGAGGFRIEAAGSKGSSYLAELAGALDVLRSLMDCVEAEGAPGVVVHWCDNQSVVELISRRGRLSRRAWRSRPCRNIWGELRRRLDWWTRQGGEWNTRWVKGHVDADDQRSPDSYTVAEQLNIQADALADWAACDEGVRLPAAQADDTALPPGGVWQVAATCQSDAYWDGVMKMITQQGQATAAATYWAQRQRQRKVALPEQDVLWDTRVTVISTGKGSARRATDVFRTKLWWDHLLSPAVLARGKSQAALAATPSQCPYCPMEGTASTWHLLGECTNQDITTARRAAAEMIRAAVVRLTPKTSPHCQFWHDHFQVTAGGAWRRPLGYDQPGGAKAGTVANAWYGCFPRSWLDGWGDDCGDGAALTTGWIRGRSILGKLSGVAVRACNMVWGVVTKLWAAEQRKERISSRGSPTPAGLDDGCDADTPGVHEENLLACPLARATYRRAVGELMTRKEQARSRRRLSLQDRGITRWRDWSMREVMGWWQSETARGGGEPKRVKASRKGVGGDAAGQQRTLVDTWRRAEVLRDGTLPPAKRRRLAAGKGGGVGGDSRRGITGKPGRRQDSSTASSRTVGTRGDNGPGQQCGVADKKQTSSARQFGGSEPSRPDVAAQRGKKRGAPKDDSKQRRTQQKKTKVQRLNGDSGSGLLRRWLSRVQAPGEAGGVGGASRGDASGVERRREEEPRPGDEGSIGDLT